jgi:NDP-sugar pyrophosphorylase family protein
LLKGMILAAGRGTRLLPLTTYLPKPLLPVANHPVMTYGVHTLRALQITEIGVNVSYRSPQIQAALGDGQAFGVTLHWAVESEPLGTAGGMKGLQRALGDATVVVIAGDAILDLDLAPLVAAHRARGAFATLATQEVADPSHYGVVVTDADGRILSFQEKPAPGSAISRQANTGIYLFEPGIFDLIPAGTFCDFALDVFPTILRHGLPFFACPVPGYWRDIGNPGDYLQANLDYLAGRYHAAGCGQRVADNVLAAAMAPTGVQLSGCVVGAGVSLPEGSVLTQSVIWPGTALPTPVWLSHAVVTPWGMHLIEPPPSHAGVPALAGEQRAA